MTLKIGDYEISSQKLYDALKEAGITDDAKLAKADLNGDKKLDEEELVEFGALDEEEVKNNSDSSSDAQKSITSSQQSAIHSLVEMNESLNKQLKDTIARFSKTSDASELADAISSMESIQNQISTNERQIYNLMVQAETSAANAANAAAGANTAVANTGQVVSPTANTLVSGAGSSSAIANYALQYNGKGESEMSSIIGGAGYQFDAGQWCADFVTFCTKETYGQNALEGCSNTASCWGIGTWAEERNILMDSRRGTAIDLNQVKPGDYILYNTDGNEWRHIGIVTAVHPESGTVDTVEGNTGSGVCGTHEGVSASDVSFVLIHNIYGT